MSNQYSNEKSAPEVSVQEQSSFINKINILKKLNTITNNRIADEDIEFAIDIVQIISNNNISVLKSIDILDFCKECIPYISKACH
ncbi:hypothetical protein [Clostridium tyrobutyricum]|uniref:hypothetical protein n=1 Tax=Clostridium tyrobutyricum TaxID=1519 RepID=UPI00057E96E1|nr:hypothetical protein [Clostridium tyrobutyricum]